MSRRPGAGRHESRQPPGREPEAPLAGEGRAAVSEVGLPEQLDLFASPDSGRVGGTPGPRGDRTELERVLQAWMAARWLRPLDLAFATWLGREVPAASPWLLLAAALASHQLGRGHGCLDIGDMLRDPAGVLALPPEDDDTGQGSGAPPHPAVVVGRLSEAAWLAALDCPALVGAPGPGAQPLVRAGTRLYLRRYWRYEQDVREGIARRLALPPAATAGAVWRNWLERLFGEPGQYGDAPDWQRLACALVGRGAFGVITGGPGTGKTTTVVKLLALLQALALAPGGRARPLQIRLAAPTGKAAARLHQSIAQAVSQLPLRNDDPLDAAILAAIPIHVTTLHRLLGSRPDTRRFRHHAGHPLPLDVLVIDEASMVDLERMAAVLDALPLGARLILLGDKDQLASVEAGAVLGELCRRAEQGHYLPETADWLAEVCGEAPGLRWQDEAGRPLDQAVVQLRVSHRFSADSGIGRLARAVNAGDAAGSRAILDEARDDLVVVRLPHELDERHWPALLLHGRSAARPGADDGGAADGYRRYLALMRLHRPGPEATDAAWDAWANQVLRAHAGFQVLCAVRRGPWGVEGLNARIADVLHRHGEIAATQGWYPGRPVLVTRNDYGLGLMNGDIGVTLSRFDPATAEWRLRVAFAASDGGDTVRWVLPSRLNHIETVYALTVHKSQGSEFEHAVLVLPDSPTPILTRELVYTGITRARSRLTLVPPAQAAVWDEAVQRRVQRAGGLVLEG
ncbi:MAG: exodeoxyribonuclease V subunit alpha [Pigmentiphaga sp.]|nr:exodeoxyribonuclease V subunit alpha [Pigmentiphaga sp.]